MKRFSDFELKDENKIFAVFMGFIIGLLLLEVFIGGYYQASKQSIYEDCYRVSESASTLEPFIEHIKQVKASGEKVLVILGGSTSYSASTTGKDAPSCFLSKKLEGIRVYNLATDGNRVTDDYLVFKAVNEYADYIVVNGYYGWFYFPSTNNQGKEFIAHPEFTFLPGVSDEDSKDMLALMHSEKKAEYFLDSIAKNSLIYSNRQLIQQELIGNTPEEKPRELLREAQCVFFNRCNLARYTAFTEKDESTQRAILEASEYRLAPVTDPTSIPIKYWKKIALEAKGKVFFYMNPMNPALGVLSATNYSTNIEILESELNKENVVFRDFTFNHNIQPSEFTDATHTLASGNKKIADLIYELVQK